MILNERQRKSHGTLRAGLVDGRPKNAVRFKDGGIGKVLGMALPVIAAVAMPAMAPALGAAVMGTTAATAGLAEGLIGGALMGAATGGIGAALGGGDPIRGALGGAASGLVGGGLSASFDAGGALSGIGGSLGAIGRGALIGGATGLTGAIATGEDPLQAALTSAAMGGLGGAARSAGLMPGGGDNKYFEDTPYGTGGGTGGSQQSDGGGQYSYETADVSPAAQTTEYAPEFSRAAQQASAQGQTGIGAKAGNWIAKNWLPTAGGLALAGAAIGGADQSKTRQAADQQIAQAGGSFNEPLPSYEWAGASNPSVGRDMLPYQGDVFTYGQRPSHMFFNPTNAVRAAKGGLAQYPAGNRPKAKAAGALPVTSYIGGGGVHGPGSGQDDAVPAMLSDGEYVVPADIVSKLGDGSTNHGAKKLNSMVKNVRGGKPFPRKTAKNPLKYAEA
jgi:hypothetical protein